jgi:hypothetical protein
LALFIGIESTWAAAAISLTTSLILSNKEKPMLSKQNPQSPDNQQDTGEAAFKKWMSAVDIAVGGRAFVSVYDLPDQPYRDWFEDGMSADEAAVAVLVDAGYGDGLLDDDCDAFAEALWE